MPPPDGPSWWFPLNKAVSVLASRAPLPPSSLPHSSVSELSARALIPIPGGGGAGTGAPAGVGGPPSQRQRDTEAEGHTGGRGTETGRCRGRPRHRERQGPGHGTDGGTPRPREAQGRRPGGGPPPPSRQAVPGHGQGALVPAPPGRRGWGGGGAATRRPPPSASCPSSSGLPSQSPPAPSTDAAPAECVGNASGPGGHPPCARRRSRPPPCSRPPSSGEVGIEYVPGVCQAMSTRRLCASASSRSPRPPPRFLSLPPEGPGLRAQEMGIYGAPTACPPRSSHGLLSPSCTFCFPLAFLSFLTSCPP